MYFKFNHGPSGPQFTLYLRLEALNPHSERALGSNRVERMEEKQKALLAAVFGESSDGEVSDHLQLDGSGEFSSHSEGNPTWEPISGVNGLWLCRGFLSQQEQSSLLSAIDKEGWFSEASHNQAMRFGNLPEWATELSYSIRQAVLFSDHVSECMDSASSDADKEASILPCDILWREPLFDQLILNVYQPGEGICPHVDLMRFEDGIAIVSLESSCVMHFTHADETEARDSGREGRNSSSMARIPVYLTPGSLVLMSGEARYSWKHEINRKPGFQMWERQEIDQKRRTSITLRKLCRTE